MASRNGYHYKTESFQEALEQAIKAHNDRLVKNEVRHYFTEPTQHDILYAPDLNRAGQKVMYPDGVPVEPSLGAPEPEDIADRIRRQMQGRALAELAKSMDADTFEEAQDFQVEENQDKCPYSGHEYSEQDEERDAVAWANEKKRREDEEAAQIKEKKKQEYLELKKQYESSAPPSATLPPAEPKSGD